ncbi:hypothetical protein C8F04DRAFT_1127522 [Mycena alexandri]|uniref:F-box domain-containing protein n=1 Tax=Mycena alexandri TaxID=1745969 RepID=A0AAD6SE09_9AGAR|nr:hypothetical protein C8F04DRAFT_1127522 [Mycena alexandri]
MPLNANHCSFESPVNHLLHTNAIPSAQECAWITDILVQPRKDLAAIDEEIRRIQQTLDKLHGRRKVLATDIDAHLALLSPVRHLPHDILREIFVSSLPSTHNAIIAGREAPLLLCHVCSGWRSIAFATPRLWSSLHVVVPTQSQLQDTIFFLAQQWLARSGILPLSLSIGISFSVVDEDDAHVLPFLELMAAVANRWESVDFSIPLFYHLGWFSQWIYALSPANVPQLTRLKFSSCDDVMLASPLLSSPTISNLTLPCIPDNANFTSISWQYLTHLELRSNGRDRADEIFGILERCVNLQVCTLTIPVGDNLIIADDHIIVLPNLTALSVTCLDYNASPAAAMIFEHLRIPELAFFECFEDTTFLVAKLSASQTKLRHLAISGVFTQTMFMDLNESSEIFPSSLETLQLTSKEPEWESFGFGASSVDGDILRVLGPDTLPILTTLKIEGLSEITDTAVLSLIRARADTATPLRNVDIAFPRAMEVDILPELADLISYGLVVSLKYEPGPCDPGDQYTYCPWQYTDISD